MIKRGILAFGLILGVAASVYVPRVFASRNSSGTYTLPTGTTVTSGTTIQSSWANTLTSDIQTELTNSLDRNGRGAMLAPLQCSSGSVSAPSLTFSVDTDTGLYRVGANDLGLTAGGVKGLDILSTGASAPIVFTTLKGITATQSTTNGDAITATGNGTGKGGVFTGGSSNGVGVSSTGIGTGVGVLGTGGATNAAGVRGNGTGTGAGVYGLGGSTSAGGYGGDFLAQGTNSAGVNAVGAGTGAGGLFTGGGSAGSGGPGIVVTSNGTTRGAIEFGDSNPSATTAFSNAITKANFIKAWGHVTTNGSGTATLDSGFNIDTVACGSTANDFLVVTMKTAMTGTNSYAVVALASQSGTDTSVVHSSSTAFNILASACDTVAQGYDFIVVGLQ